jgi:hypothetical protein
VRIAWTALCLRTVPGTRHGPSGQEIFLTLNGPWCSCPGTVARRGNRTWCRTVVPDWGTAAWPLPRDDRALFEDLAAPDPVGFAAFDRSGQAGRAERARLAMRPGQVEVGWQAGEPQLRVLALAWQRPVQCPRLAGEPGHRGDGHGTLPAAGDRLGAGMPGWAHLAGRGTSLTAGGLMGTHDIRIARVARQRLLPPAARPVTVLGGTDLPHLGPLSGLFRCCACYDCALAHGSSGSLDRDDDLRAVTSGLRTAEPVRPPASRTPPTRIS